MGTIVAVEYVSLDGVMESPAWSMPYFNEELQQFQYDNLFGADALLLGRVTYDGFRTSWPSMTMTAARAALPRSSSLSTCSSASIARRSL